MLRSPCPTCSCGYAGLSNRGDLPQYQITLSQVRVANISGGADGLKKFLRGKGITVLNNIGTGRPALKGNLVGICRNVRVGVQDIFTNCKGTNPNDPDIDCGC